MKEENLTLYDIQRASTNYLKSCLKYDIDVEVDGQVYSYGNYWSILEDDRFN